MSTVELDPRTVPGAVEIALTRELPDGSRIDFESSPAGSLTAEGEIRRKDYRAYYFAPRAACQPCEGTGRAPSEKRPGGKVKCQPCKGSGIGPRTRLASVSTLLDAICPKGGLPPWAEARGIEGAVTAIQRGDMPSTIDPREAVAVVRALKLGADRARDDAADRGLNIHALLEQYMRTGDAPDPPTHVEHQGYYQALCRWLLKVNPEPLDDDATGVEELVASPEDGYAGRRDLRARCGEWVIGFDAKTQERGGIFLAAHQQLRLYERAGIACGDDPCDWLKVVVFAANGEFREMDCMALDSTVDAALAYYREIKPIDAACARHNEIEKQARRA